MASLNLLFLLFTGMPVKKYLSDFKNRNQPGVRDFQH